MSESTTLTPAPAAASAPKVGKLKAIGLLMLAVGGLLCLFAYMGDEESKRRFGFAYMLGFVFCWAIVAGSLFFVALQHATGSVWSVVLRRAAEMLAAPIWVLAVLFVPLLMFALLNPDYGIFQWMKADWGGPHGTAGKEIYLSENFFLLRTLLFFAIWIGFAFFFVRGSVRQDGGGPNVAGTRRMRKVSGPFIILFGFTLTFAAFDWLMSLEPHWFSTIYGVYVFAGVTLSALAAITLFVVTLRAKGLIAPELIKRDHLYSLGGLMFAFTCFWGYIAFSQFMLIWYGNLPEETIYFVHRIEHGWMPVTWGLVFLRFIIPFFLLLARGSKMDGARLAQVSILILVGQLVDLYWLIMPQFEEGTTPYLGWQELGPPLLFTGALILYLGLFMGRHKLVAAGDPMFEKSRNFHL